MTKLRQILATLVVLMVLLATLIIGCSPERELYACGGTHTYAADG